MVSKSKLTPKQREFAELVSGGKTLSDSYRGAYSSENMKLGSIHREASVLMSNPMVTQRVERLQRKKDRAVVAIGINDREMVLSQLHHFIENATPADSAKIRAAELLGKSVGLFSEVIVNKSEEKTIEDIDREIAERIAELEEAVKH